MDGLEHPGEMPASCKPDGTGLYRCSMSPYWVLEKLVGENKVMSGECGGEDKRRKRTKRERKSLSVVLSLVNQCGLIQGFAGSLSIAGVQQESYYFLQGFFMASLFGFDCIVPHGFASMAQVLGYAFCACSFRLHSVMKEATAEHSRSCSPNWLVTN